MSELPSGLDLRGRIFTDEGSSKTIYNGDLKVLLPATDLQLLLDLSKPSSSIALYTCERDERHGHFEIHRTGKRPGTRRIPLSHPPPSCLALLALSFAGKGELEALRDLWSGDAETFLPKSTFVDVADNPEAAAAEIQRSLFDALARIYGTSAARVVSLQKQYTALRSVHDQLQNAFDTVENFLVRLQFPGTWLAFACEPEESGVGPQRPDKPFQLTQRLPLSSQGLAAVELHANPAGRGSEGLLTINIVTCEDNRVLGEWEVPYRAVPDGWMYLDLPEIDIAPRQSVTLNAIWNTRSGLPPKLSLTKLQPVPESRVCFAGGSESRRSLALRLHVGLPGSRRVAHPFHVAVMRQPHISRLGRRLAPSVLHRCTELDSAPGSEPRVRLLREGAIEVRPVNGGMTVAKLPGAFPGGARRLTATIMTEGADGPLVEYAVLALGPRGPYKQVLTKGLLNGGHGGFSGWVPIYPAFTSQIHLRVSEPTDQPLDLYLATRLVQGQTVDFAMAKWLEFIVDAFLDPSPP
jgi:hypothetical protein